MDIKKFDLPPVADNAPVVIKVESLVKRFVLRHTRSMKEAFVWLMKGRKGDLNEKFNALNGVSLDIREGERVALLGYNGSGKSTLCNALVGLIPYYFTGKLKWQIFVDGVDTQESSIAELSSKIGLVFQNPFNQLSYTAGSVAEELAYGLGNKGIPREDMLKKV